MRPETDAPGLAQFFDSYFAAYRRFDAASIADHFTYPSQITSDAEEVALTLMAAPEDCARAVERVLGPHRKLGVTGGNLKEFTISPLSPRLIQATMRAEMRAGTEALYEFEAVYTVALRAGNWKITAIAHNQIPRLSACVAGREAR